MAAKSTAGPGKGRSRQTRHRSRLSPAGPRLLRSPTRGRNSVRDVESDICDHPCEKGGRENERKRDDGAKYRRPLQRTVVTLHVPGHAADVRIALTFDAQIFLEPYISCRYQTNRHCGTGQDRQAHCQSRAVDDRPLTEPRSDRSPHSEFPEFGFPARVCVYTHNSHALRIAVHPCWFSPGL